MVESPEHGIETPGSTQGGNILTKKLLASQEGIYSMELSGKSQLLYFLWF
jgi:hypothetical protein